MQASSDQRLLRGAQAIADHLNKLLSGGKRVSRAAVYRMIEDGKLPVTRLGLKGSEVWTTAESVERALGLPTTQNDTIPTKAA